DLAHADPVGVRARIGSPARYRRRHGVPRKVDQDIAGEDVARQALVVDGGRDVASVGEVLLQRQIEGIGPPGPELRIAAARLLPVERLTGEGVHGIVIGEDGVTGAAGQVVHARTRRGLCGGKPQLYVVLQPQSEIQARQDVGVFRPDVVIGGVVWFAEIDVFRYVGRHLLDDVIAEQ